MENLESLLLKHLLNGESSEAVSLARDAVAQGVSPVAFIEACVTPALAEIGRRFEELEVFLPEMLEAAEIVQEINDEVISPALEGSHSAERTKSLGKVLLATVQGDLHDIGKNMVAMLLGVSGFEVVDMGIDVPPGDVVRRAAREAVDIIGLSTLLTTCLPYVKDTVEFLELKGIRDDYAVIIGGAAPTAEFSQQIGVDAYGHSAGEAVAICRSIMKSRAGRREA
jgi:methylmalonyl-CoA mutase cobalamin-binding domain/chain